MKKLNTLLTVTAAFISLLSFCQPGSLDAGFDLDGKQTTHVQMPFNTMGQATAIQADGKIIVAGQITSDLQSYYNLLLRRYNADGSPDNSFGSNGVVITANTTSNCEAKAVAIQPDGKIVVAGIINYKFAVLRYNSNGTLDNSFNLTGMVITTIGTYSYANVLALPGDGKIVVAGYSEANGNGDFTIARYNNNGTADNSFGVNGIATTDISGGLEDVYAIVMQGSKIVVAGYTQTLDGNKNFALARYTPGGVLDFSFGSGGKTITDMGSRNSLAHSMVIQSDGKIIAGGYSYDRSDFSDFRFAVARYTANGTLDPAFAVTGVVQVTAGQGYAVALQPGGKILVAGKYNAGDDSYGFGVLRLNTDGYIDNGFGVNGMIKDIGDMAFAMAVQPDAKIVAAGYSYNSQNKNNNLAVARYDKNGAADNSFGAGHMVISEYRDANTNTDFGQASAIQPDGKIIVSGNVTFPGGSMLGLARYNTNGSPDNSFHWDGNLVANFPERFNYAVAIQQDGKILTAGYFRGAQNHDFIVTRTGAQGEEDETFNIGGIAFASPGSHNDIAYAIAIQADNNIVVAGSSYNGHDYDISLARFKPDGSLDISFGVNGTMVKAISSGDDGAYSVVIQPDGKIVVAGYTYNGFSYDVVVLRLLNNGSPDNSFGINGIVKKGFSKTSNVYGRSVSIQPDGKIVVAGYTNSGAGNDYILFRYNSNGTPDLSFNVTGYTTGSFDIASSDYCTGVVVQGDGKIVLGGYFYKNATNKNDFGLVRFLSNGKPDGSFGTAGKVITDFAGADDYANSLSLQQDGKIILAGSSGNSFALARYNNSGTLLAPVINTTFAGALKNVSVVDNNFNVYPNPVTSTASIHFTSNEQANCTIELWDASGRKIKTIFNGMSIGMQTIPFSRQGLKGGIYFLHLNAGTRKEVKKLVIE